MMSFLTTLEVLLPFLHQQKLTKTFCHTDTMLTPYEHCNCFSTLTYGFCDVLSSTQHNAQPLRTAVAYTLKCRLPSLCSSHSRRAGRKGGEKFHS